MRRVILIVLVMSLVCTGVVLAEEEELIEKEDIPTGL